MSTMSNEEIIKVVQASIDGEQFEFSYPDGDIWYDLQNAPVWNFAKVIYRVKQLTLEEFIEEMIESHMQSCPANDIVISTCKKIKNHMKKLQGESNASRD